MIYKYLKIKNKKTKPLICTPFTNACLFTVFKYLECRGGIKNEKN